MSEFRNYALGLAAFAIVLHVTLVVAAFGLISLLTDTDVIAEPDAGTLVGPTMVAASVLMASFLWLRIVRQVPPEDIRVSLAAALGVGFASWFSFVIVGSVLYIFSTGQVFSFAVFMAAHMISPFAITAGLIATILTVLYLAMLARKARGSHRPRWPWESDQDS